MPRRAAFISDITYLIRPILRSPTSRAGAFVKTSSHVGEPLMPSLFSMRRTLTPPSRLSCTSIDKPRASVVPSSVRASTSEMSPSPLVMKRLTPLSSHVCRSSDQVAFSITAPRSEPASGSVRSMAQVSPADTRGRNSCLSSSEANSLSVSAQSCRPQMFSKPASARATISLAMTKQTSGKFRPSYLRGSVRPLNPASTIALRLRTVPEAYSTWSFTTRGPS